MVSNYFNQMIFLLTILWLLIYTPHLIDDRYRNRAGIYREAPASWCESKGGLGMGMASPPFVCFFICHNAVTFFKHTLMPVLKITNETKSDLLRWIENFLYLRQFCFSCFKSLMKETRFYCVNAGFFSL